MAKIPLNIIDRVRGSASKFFKKRLKDISGYAKKNPGKTALFGAAAAAPVAMHALSKDEEEPQDKMASLYKKAAADVAAEIAERKKAEAPQTGLSKALQGQKHLDELHRPDPLSDITGSELAKDKDNARVASKQTLDDQGS